MTLQTRTEQNRTEHTRLTGTKTWTRCKTRIKIRARTKTRTKTMGRVRAGRS